MSTETNYKENLSNGEKPSPVITQAKDSNMQPNLSTSYGRKSSEVLYKYIIATLPLFAVADYTLIQIYAFQIHDFLW